MTDAPPPSTYDVLFLAITRMAMIYGVPLVGFLLAGGAAAIVFDLTHRYNVFWRAGICLAAFGVVLLVMRQLTSWEPKWWPILVTWANTRLPVLFSAATRAFGGSTFCPVPVDTRKSIEELRDYAG